MPSPHATGDNDEVQEVTAPRLMKTEPVQTQQQYGEQPGQQYHAGELQQVDEQMTRGVFFLQNLMKLIQVEYNEGEYED